MDKLLQATAGVVSMALAGTAVASLTEVQPKVFGPAAAEEVVLLKKQVREEEMIFVNPKMKNKKTKGAKAVESGEGGKMIKHNANTFQLFHSLKLGACVCFCVFLCSSHTL